MGFGGRGCEEPNRQRYHKCEEIVKRLYEVIRDTRLVPVDLDKSLPPAIDSNPKRNNLTLAEASSDWRVCEMWAVSMRRH